ncbi:MAG: diacylglycerol kinase family lipid kinase [Prevotellaceae bacterium]|jgi:YegS/Rv2252/BmrU family lipid kinase|nr:diacylglycerol kinase family lipid kinase [Prevotellaceae bacterium]
MRKIAFILNPLSGKGNKEAVEQYISHHFGWSTGFDTRQYTTRCAGDGYELARQFAAQGFDAVVAVGGDGTINEIARGLVHSPTAMGIVPMGSGNGLARHLRLPMDFKKALEKITHFQTRAIDAAQINGRLFFCTAGVGFDALIGHLFNSGGKRGISTYISLSTREFLQYKPQEYTVTTDGQTHTHKAFLITFANASQWGNNAYIAPLAHCNDGQLDVVIWKDFPRVAAPFMLPRLFTKTIHKSSFVEMYQCKHIIVERPQEDYVHLDGETLQMGKVLDIQVLPSALKVLV